MKFRILLLTANGALLTAALFTPELLSAQRDTSVLLDMQRMGPEDIDSVNPDATYTMVRTATRYSENADKLPFTTYVISEEDILANGFVTLGDVLKSVPGVRVSQPGNALEGETFLVRGLPGNQYMTVLINDVPIKPSGAPGIPIGAQLPIRQAQRIEVYFGPASAVWGNGACAGVVNIILKETERPIFTRAELTFGNYGYNGLDLSFGGKLGRDKNIFRYSIYGSSTIRENTDIFYDEDLYNPDYYLPFGLDTSLYLDNPNYQPVIVDDRDPSPIGHESRLFGFAFKWHGLTFNYNRMARFEHTALGLNPVAIAYSNPSNRIGERIETFSLGFERSKKRRHSYYTFSAVRYRMDDASNSTLVFDRLSSATYYVQSGSVPPDLLPQLRRSIFQELASEERYTVANGLDARAEIRYQTGIFSNFLLDFGGQLNLSFVYPALGHQRRPLSLPIFGDPPPADIKPFAPELTGSSDLNAFIQLQWISHRFNMVAGTAVNLNDQIEAQIAPRFGCTFRFDSTWSVYGNAGTAFRRPDLFETVNRYTIEEATPGVRLRTSTPTGETERVDLAELGLRMRTLWLESTTLGYYQQAFELSRNGYLIQQVNSGGQWNYGYENAPGLALRNWGLQQWFVIQNEDIGVGLRNNPNRLRFKGEVFFQYTRGNEWFGYGLPSTDQVRNMPGWTSQVRASCRRGKFQLSIATLRNRGMLSKSVVYQDFYNQQRLKDYPKYRTWDVMARLYLSNQFLLYVQVQNLFNRRYAGIDATGTPDDLLYNPQQRRLLRLGVNYNMSDRGRTQNPF